MHVMINGQLVQLDCVVYHNGASDYVWLAADGTVVTQIGSEFGGMAFEAGKWVDVEVQS